MELKQMAAIQQKELFASNLKKWMDIRGVTQDDIVKALGYSSSTVSDWVNAKKYPRVDKMQELADLLCVPISHLREDRSSIYGPKPASTRIPVLGRIPAGVPLEAIEEVIDWEEISSDMLRGGKQYFALQIKGDSMEPEYLNGDVIIVLKQDDAETGDDVVAMVNGNDATFKRLSKAGDGVILRPINPKYDPMLFSAADVQKLPVRVLGVCVELRRKKR